MGRKAVGERRGFRGERDGVVAWFSFWFEVVVRLRSITVWCLCNLRGLMDLEAGRAHGRESDAGKW